MSSSVSNWAACHPAVHHLCASVRPPLALRRLVAAVSRRTRRTTAPEPVETLKPPQDAAEIQLDKARAAYHLPMLSVARILGHHDELGGVDTKQTYETLLAIRARRDTGHSGEMELGAHCDINGRRTGARHEAAWYWRFRQPGCDDAYGGEDIFPALLPFDVDTQCKVVEILKGDAHALAAGCASHPDEKEAVHLPRWHELVTELTEQYPEVVYYTPGPRDTQRDRAQAVRASVSELVRLYILPDPRALRQTAEATVTAETEVAADATAMETETVVNLTSVDDAEAALLRLAVDAESDAESSDDDDDGGDGWGSPTPTVRSSTCFQCPACGSDEAVPKQFRCRTTVAGTGGSGKAGAGAGVPPRRMIKNRIRALYAVYHECRIPERQFAKVMQSTLQAVGIEVDDAPGRSFAQEVLREMAVGSKAEMVAQMTSMNSSASGSSG